MQNHPSAAPLSDTHIHVYTHSDNPHVSLPPSWPCHERAMWRTIPPGTLTLAVPALPRLAAANWKDQENSRLKVHCFFVCLDVCVHVCACTCRWTLMFKLELSVIGTVLN